MTHRIVRALAAAVTVLFLIPSGARAEQFKEFGDYIVHYNTINTSFLSARVAREYNIQRSNRRAMLNIAVQKKSGGKTTPVNADIEVTAVNLNGQLRQVDMRAVADGEAVYYIGELGFENEETLNFTVAIKPQGAAETLQLKFREQFYLR